jgi:hypothetical protein
LLGGGGGGGGDWAVGRSVDRSIGWVIDWLMGRSNVDWLMD